MESITIAPKSLEPEAGPVATVITDRVTFKATAADTGGAYSLFRTETPAGAGVPPHFHRLDDEAFFVLEGTYEFQVGDDRVQHGPGGFVFIPRGTVHSFRNAGETTGRMLILDSPGGYHEQFFLDADAAAAAGPFDPAQLVGIAARYGVEILPPPAAGPAEPPSVR